MIIPHSILLRMISFSDGFADNITTRILYSITFFFFSKMCRFGYMLKNMVQPDWPQMTVWRILIEYWITMTRYTHSGQVILLFFHSKNGCKNVPQCNVIKLVTLPVLLLTATFTS